MKQAAKTLLLFALAGPGCVALDMNFFAPKPPAPVAMKEPDVPRPPPPQVSAGQINDKNAPVMMDALREELDYESGQPGAVPARPMSKKP